MLAVSLTLVLAVQLASGFEAGKCPGKFMKYETLGQVSCLLLSDVAENYAEARVACHKMYNGKLVTAETMWRRENLKRFLKENTKDSDFIYIGAQENVEKKTFFWDGYSTEAFWQRKIPHLHPLVIKSWREDEPDNTNGNESCVCPKSDGLWNDCKCINAKRFFICEKR